MNPAIEIKNLSFSYGDTENQLKHINLSVEKGEVIVLTGPSGSGKSTLTRVINGLIPYFFTGELSGEVWLFGKNMAEISSWERGKYVGNVFQDPRSQFFANEVAGEIAFGCENYGVPHDEIVKRVQDAAEALSITDLLEQKVRYLSYGMRQRVAIASAEAIDPDIYVMDEPSANLDMGATEDFAAFVRLLKKQGKTILIAEHRLYYLRDIADRIVYLNKGEIVSVMTPQEMNILPHEQVFEWGLRSMELLNLPFPANSGKETEQKPLLSVERLHKRFGLHEVLKDVSFSCSPGEIVAIVGPNAAGKSTLGKLLSGLLKEDGGTIRFAEKPLKKSRRRGVIWYIMQDLDSQLFGESLTDELLTGKKGNAHIETAGGRVADALEFGRVCRPASGNPVRRTKTASCFGCRSVEQSAGHRSGRAYQWLGWLQYAICQQAASCACRKGAYYSYDYSRLGMCPCHLQPCACDPRLHIGG